MRWATCSAAGSVSHTAALLILSLSGCATLEVYRAYPGPDLPDASVATVELRPGIFGKRWARIDDVDIDGGRFRSVKVLPGIHRIEWNRTFGVSFLVDPRMFVEYKHSATVTLEAGRTYRLQSDRTTGPGYRVYFWIEDAATGAVLPEIEPRVKAPRSIPVAGDQVELVDLSVRPQAPSTLSGWLRNRSSLVLTDVIIKVSFYDGQGKVGEAWVGGTADRLRGKTTGETGISDMRVLPGEGRQFAVPIEAYVPPRYTRLQFQVVDAWGTPQDSPVGICEKLLMER